MIALERDPCSKIVFTGKIIFADFNTLLDTNVRVMHSGDTSRGDTRRLSELSGNLIHKTAIGLVRQIYFL